MDIQYTFHVIGTVQYTINLLLHWIFASHYIFVAVLVKYTFSHTIENLNTMRQRQKQLKILDVCVVFLLLALFFVVGVGNLRVFAYYPYIWFTTACTLFAMHRIN